MAELTVKESKWDVRDFGAMLISQGADPQLGDVFFVNNVTKLETGNGNDVRVFSNKRGECFTPIDSFTPACAISLKNDIQIGSAQEDDRVKWTLWSQPIVKSSGLDLTANYVGLTGITIPTPNNWVTYTQVLGGISITPDGSNLMGLLELGYNVPMPEGLRIFGFIDVIGTPSSVGAVADVNMAVAVPNTKIEVGSYTRIQPSFSLEDRNFSYKHIAGFGVWKKW